MKRGGLEPFERPRKPGALRASGSRAPEPRAVAAYLDAVETSKTNARRALERDAREAMDAREKKRLEALREAHEDTRDAFERAKVLAELRASPDFEPIAITIKRVANILRDASSKGIQPGDVDEGKLDEEIEKKVFEATSGVSDHVQEALALRDFKAAFSKIGDLGVVINDSALKDKEVHKAFGKIRAAMEESCFSKGKLKLELLDANKAVKLTLPKKKAKKKKTKKKKKAKEKRE